MASLIDFINKVRYVLLIADVALIYVLAKQIMGVFSKGGTDEKI